MSVLHMRGAPLCLLWAGIASETAYNSKMGTKMDRRDGEQLNTRELLAEARSDWQVGGLGRQKDGQPEASR